MPVRSRLFWKVVAVLVGLFVVLLGWAGFSLFGPVPAIVVSRETTYLTEPLGADGLPDYGRAMLKRQRAGVTPENNGAIPFWQAMWPGELSPEDQALLLAELAMEEPAPGLVDPYEDNELRKELTRLLLVQGGHKDANQLIQQHLVRRPNERTFGYYADEESPIWAAYEQVEQLRRASEQPWTARQIPTLAVWVEENAQLLDLLVEAANRPKFYSPSPSLLNGRNEPFMAMELPSLQAIRMAVRLLSKRAYLRIAEGQHSDAWRDLRACYRFSEHIAGRNVLVGELISIACRGIANEATVHLIAQKDASPELLHDIFRGFDWEMPSQTMTDSVDYYERLGYLSTIVHLSFGNLNALSGRSSGESFKAYAIDWNIVLREGNEWYDRLAAIGRLQNGQERRAEIDQFEVDLLALAPTPGDFFASAISRKRRSQAMANIVNELMLKAMTIAFNAEDRGIAKHQLMRIAAGLAVYRARDGKYPEAIDALVPDVFGELPVDFFHNKPFHYKRTANGYLLYTLGPNGQDDGGSNQQMGYYRGYAVDDDVDSAVRELLDEPVAVGDHPDGDESDHADDGFPVDDAVSLRDLIPYNADVFAIRMPPVVVPLPDLVE